MKWECSKYRRHVVCMYGHTYNGGMFIFPVQLTTSRIGNLIRLIHNLLYVMTIHTYIHTARIVWINRVRLPILLLISWTGKVNVSLSPFVSENLVSRDGFGSPVPRQPAHLHTYSGWIWCLPTGDSSRVPRRHPFVYLKPPYAIIGTVPSLSGLAIAYRWRSLARVGRHRASKPQGSSKRVLPCLADHRGPINLIICASLFHTH